MLLAIGVNMPAHSSQDTSGKALVEHWTYAADKGLMKGNTARALRSACVQVLSALEDWEKVDVTRLDVDDAFRRFQNKRARDFTPDSLEAYQRRFSQAVKLFKEYVEDPSSWRPTKRKSAAGKERRLGAVSKANSGRSASVSVAPPPQIGLIDYPFPLSEARVALLRLPVDLKLAEVQRLTSFMMTIAVDFDPNKGTRP